MSQGLKNGEIFFKFLLRGGGFCCEFHEGEEDFS